MSQGIMKHIAWGFFIISFFTAPMVSAADAEDDDLYLGKYELVSPPQPTNSKDKVEVIEFFSYACPHCNTFQPILDNWLAKQAADVEFIHLPVVYHKTWLPLAKAYYTAEALDVQTKVHNVIFDELHNKKRNVRNEQGLAKIFKEHAGIDNATFKENFNSFYVTTKVTNSNGAGQKYGITGVPVVVINGKYRLSSELAGGYHNLLKVADYLIAKERKNLPAKAEEVKEATAETKDK